MLEKNFLSINKPLTKDNVSEDIQAILTVIGRRKYFYKDDKIVRLDLHEMIFKLRPQ
jgi:hypothetical protein